MSEERKLSRREQAAEKRKIKAAEARRSQRNQRRREKRALDKKHKRLRELFDLDLLESRLFAPRPADVDALLRNSEGEAWSPAANIMERELLESAFRGDPESDDFDAVRDELDRPLEQLAEAAGWQVQAHLSLFWETGAPMTWTLSVWDIRAGDGRGALIQTDEVEGTRLIACYRGDDTGQLLAGLLTELVASNGASCNSGLMGSLPTDVGLSSDVLEYQDLERAFWRYVLEETRGSPDRWVDIEADLRQTIDQGGPGVISMSKLLEEAVEKLTPEAHARRTAEGNRPLLRQRLALLREWLAKVC